MKTFSCVCGQTLFFDNSLCFNCGREAGFVPSRLDLTSIEPAGDIEWRELGGRGTVRKCGNAIYGVCNWVIEAEDGRRLCVACRLNRVIPDLSEPENLRLWGEFERAKRRLVYSLLSLDLPVVPRNESRTGLAFDVKGATDGERVLTGHADGIVTLNLAEGDPVLREKMRVDMNERYRTVLGHFRHESGHYYWQLLVDDSPLLARFRELFGDEREDYRAALERHYNSTDWHDSVRFISDYASAHPWEDWAETWAGYLHMIDALESATALGIADLNASRDEDFDAWIACWGRLTMIMNELNRSMGLPDAFPFRLTGPVIEKLAFVNQAVSAGRTSLR